MKLVFGVNYKHEQKGETLTISSLANVVPVPDSILLTREQFNELRAKIAGDAFEAGERREHAANQYFNFNDEFEAKRLKTYEETPDKQQYLSSLTAVPLEAEVEKSLGDTEGHVRKAAKRLIDYLFENEDCDPGTPTHDLTFKCAALLNDETVLQRIEDAYLKYNL